MSQHATLYRHVKRPEWGYCAIAETQDDRTVFAFDDGSRRTILHDHIHMMTVTEPAEPEATEVRTRIGKLAPSKLVGADGKPKAKKSGARKAPKRTTAPA